MQPLVSIITPAYNADAYIEEMICSVLSQTYTNWELIIVDDASTDETKTIISKYLQCDTRIRYVRNNKNNGPAKSRNKGIDASFGEYIAFLDSDDSWLPKKLEKQIEFMHKENIQLSYTAYYTVDPKGAIIASFSVPHTVTYVDMLKTSSIGTLTTIYHAKRLGKIYFPLLHHEDYVLKLNILKHIPCAKGINEPLAKYRRHSQSLSQNKLKTALWQWHIYRKVEKLSFIKSFYYFIHYTYFGFFKYRT